MFLWVLKRFQNFTPPISKESNDARQKQFDIKKCNQLIIFFWNLNRLNLKNLLFLLVYSCCFPWAKRIWELKFVHHYFWFFIYFLLCCTIWHLSDKHVFVHVLFLFLCTNFCCKIICYRNLLFVKSLLGKYSVIVKPCKGVRLNLVFNSYFQYKMLRIWKYKKTSWSLMILSKEILKCKFLLIIQF